MIAALSYIFLGTLRIGTPIAITAAGACVSERTGVMNLGLDGFMTIGAFVAVLGDYFFSNPWLGILLAIIVGIIVSLIYGFITIICGGVQGVVSMAINLLGTGFCAVVLRAVFKQAGYTPTVETINTTECLRGIPVLGDILASMSPLFYICLLILLILDYLVYYTPLGLRMAACGENPKAADTAGIPVNLLRFLGVMISGALGALGGAYLSVGYMNLFQEGMIAGRGFLAVGAVIMGRWNPKLVYLAALMFGLFDAVQLYLQLYPSIAIPTEFIQAIPYIASVIVMACSTKNVTCPQSLGESYSRVAGTR